MEGKQGRGLIRSLGGRLAVAIGTGLGSGYFPIAPGTVGSAVGLALYAVLVRLRVIAGPLVPGLAASGAPDPGGFPAGWVIILCLVFALGWASAWHLERRFGPDNKRIVIDEVWGMLISLALVPPGVGVAVGGFFLFRLFDIVKPFPGRRAEKVPGGAGVMLDDGVAGLYACLALYLAHRLVG